jgi:hypothetical protein
MMRGMSASGPKQTSLAAPHMSAFGGNADLVIALRNFRYFVAVGGADALASTSITILP